MSAARSAITSANQLETIGFTVDRQYKTRTEASPIWVQGNPDEGLWHIYTGGWITTAISRDDGSNFSFFYTPLITPSPCGRLTPPPTEFDAVALKLCNNDFATMEERGELFGRPCACPCRTPSASGWSISSASRPKMPTSRWPMTWPAV